MNNIKRITALVMAMLMSIIMFSGLTNVKAAQTAHVSISSASANVGGEVTITVTASSDVKIEQCDIFIDYDSNILQYVKEDEYTVGGGGTVRLLSTEKTEFHIKFMAINPGTATISVNKSTSYISSADEDYMSLTTSSGSVNVKAPASYSSDNTLKSLQISPGTLSPAFSPDRRIYNATVDADVTELVVSAAANDSAAKISISGRRMDPGSNTTTITVTAEDGSVNKYIIYTTRLENGQEATTEAESKTETVTEDASQTVNNDGTVTVDGRKYSVVKDYSGITIPDGYQEIDYDYNGQKINAVKGIKTGLILMYLESEDGKGGFYIYDETAKTFSPYNTVAEPEITYVVLPITNSLDKPEGYTLTKFTMNGKEVQVLIDSERNFCLFYGVSSLGEKGWFRYRVSDGTIQVYSENAVVPADSQGDSQVAKTSGSRFWIAIVTLMTVIAVVFIIITILLSAKLSKLKKVFNMASRDSVDLDEYAKKEIDEYDMDDYEELSTKVSYGDDKSGKNDVEELNLFDIDDEK